MNMTSGIDKSSLRPLLGHGEYELLVSELFATFSTNQDSTLRQEGQGHSQSLNWTVEGQEGGSDVILKVTHKTPKNI